MKKLLIFLLLPLWALAQTSTGQEQEFPYGILVPASVLQVPTTTTWIGTFGPDGTQGKVAPQNISIPQVPTNYAPTTFTIGGHLSGIDTKLGALSGTTAGAFNRVWFTADQTTITAGTFDLTNPATKGTAASHQQTVANDDNQKKYFTTDLIGQPFAMVTTFPQGIYSGNLSASTTPTNANQKFTVELYKCNNAGTPIASGVTGAVVGDLGVTVIMILDSGEITLANASITNVTVSAVLGSGGFTIATGERIRYHVSAEKVGTSGTSINESVYYGSSYNSYLDVPVIYNSTSIKDVSAITSGAGTVTDALNSLNSGKENISNKSDSYTASSSTTYASSAALVSGLGTKIGFYNQSTRDIQSKSGTFLILGDSFTEAQGATSYKNGFSNIVTRSILNASKGYGYSSIINVSNEINAGTGVTTSGTIVTTGVVGSRLQLTSGQTITITGRQAASFDVIYDGAVSSGSLEFRLNGTLLFTKALSGSGLNTTYPTEMNYYETKTDDVVTITATATAVVTAIVTLKISTGKPIPFIVGKSGNAYQDYTSSPYLDEIAYYLNYNNGKKTVVLALGTNNLYSGSKALTPSAMLTQIGLVISGIRSRVSDSEFLITIPAKTNESVYPIIESGFTYQDYVNSILAYCETNNHTPVRYDKTQMGTGDTDYLYDNVHPNDLGHKILANKINEALGVTTNSDDFAKFQPSSITGTTNQIITTPTAINTSILSLPQDIAPASSPVFQSLSTSTYLTALVAKIGYRYDSGSSAWFGHKDFNTATNYGYFQESSGDVYIDAPVIKLSQTTGNKIEIGTGTGIEKFNVFGKATVSGAPVNPTDVVRKTELDLKANIDSPNFINAPTAPTAAPGTNTTQIATTAFVQANARPYKVYTALLTQSSTSAPVATVIENTLGGTVVWTYSSVGGYVGTLTGAFTNNKTSAIISNGQAANALFGSYRVSDNAVIVSSTTAGTGAAVDGVLWNATIEIKVQN